MRWGDFRQSSNVEDRRGMGMGARVGGGLGIGGMVIVGLVSLFLGVDPRVLLGLAEQLPNGGGFTQEQTQGRGAPQDESGRFVSAVLATTEDAWSRIFQQNGQRYEPPRLVMFSRAVQSGCGAAQSATGPFYCPLDRRIYLDTSFFRQLSQRFGAPGDFAAAYVIAHEVGHHVQNITGVLPRVQEAQRRGGGRRGNQISVMAELQADCYAGIWAREAGERFKLLEEGDIEEAIQAANAIGDDRLQRQSQGQVVPDSFTHGSSAQRVRWFTVGVRSGSLDACNTFDAPSL